MPLTLSTTMTQISLISYPRGGRPNLWGVDASYKIYHYTASSWTQIPGELKQVSAATDGTVWGVNAAGLVWRYNAGGNTWTQMPGNLAQVAVAKENGVWGVNAAGQVWQYNAGGNTWTPLAGAMKQLSAYWSQGGGIWRLWGINTEGHACQYNFDSNSWDVIPNDNTSGTLVQVEIEDDMTYWVLDSAGNTLIYRGAPTWWGASMFTNMKDMSPAHDSSFAFIDATGKTIVYDPSNQ